MKTTLATLALAALLCGCDTPDDGDVSGRTAMDDATIGTPAPSDPRNASDQPPQPEDDVEVPARYRGDWAADAAACERPGEVSRLHIDDDGIRFHESEGPIVSAEERDGTLSITARLTGEGETREASYAFTLSPDRNTLTDAGGYARRRCD
jgi:hypothetical protein